MRTTTTARISYSVLNVIVLLALLFPFLWMISASLKTQIQILNPDNLFKFTPTFDNYVTVFKEYDYLKYISSSLIVGVLSTLGALALGLPAAYAIAKYKMDSVSVVILVAKILPGISYLVPWYVLFNKLHLIDSYLGLILSHMVIGLPFIMWIMIPFFASFPREVEESSWIDGSSRMRTFVQMVLPVSLPGIITASLLAFIYSWNNFMFSFVLAGESTKTLPIAIYSFVGGASIQWGALMAAACIITLPVIIIAMLAQKYVVSGLSAGAVKG
ncbi:carbohydrate ABC transporter permease [Cohnella cholangitidis]|uniref:Carbohydrate ABC transporter permease n=1 Tax=Cohnella cholangitidis TaxID=2598458 RepID=A0A7G5C3Y4_9BACL|nr:carbohydrate ABC transporter permease [Cohnella cholangitidis]QMV43918.1 carbohydrate ABC transporter permease [Cohnella cholangitidis]